MKSRKGRLQRLDIVMTTRGSIGKVALFDCEPPKGLINAQMLILRADGEIIDQKYLFYQTCSKDFQAKLKNFASGSAQPQIPIIDLKEVEVAVADLPTQRKIASILSTYDDLIENNTRRIKILEDMAATIYRQWFVEFRFPGHENVPMVESELGSIPHGWEVGRLGDLCSVVPGYAFKSKDWQDKGVAVVKIKNIKSDNTIDTQNVNCVSPEILLPKLDKYRLENADFLIAMTGATAGKIGRLRTKTIMMLNQRVAKLNPIDGYRDYIWCKISH